MDRKDLVIKLNDTIDILVKQFLNENKDLGVFLHQSICINADEETLLKIIEDCEKHIK